MEEKQKFKLVENCCAEGIIQELSRDFFPLELNSSDIDSYKMLTTIQNFLMADNGFSNYMLSGHSPTRNDDVVIKATHWSVYYIDKKFDFYIEIDNRTYNEEDFSEFLIKVYSRYMNKKEKPQYRFVQLKDWGTKELIEEVDKDCVKMDSDIFNTPIGWNLTLNFIMLSNVRVSYGFIQSEDVVIMACYNHHVYYIDTHYDFYIELDSNERYEEKDFVKFLEEVYDQYDEYKSEEE